MNFLSARDMAEKKLEFKICTKTGIRCRCLDDVEPPAPRDFCVYRDHLAVGRGGEGEREGEGPSKKHKIEFCNNPLHRGMGEDGPPGLLQTYHFSITEKPAWFYDCKLPFEEQEKNEKLLILSKFFDNDCFCERRGLERCFHCNNIQHYNIFAYRGKAAHLPSLFLLDPYIDWEKLKAARPLVN